MSVGHANGLVEELDHSYSDDVEYLAAFSQFFAVSRDLATTLDMALLGIAQGVEAEGAALFLLDEETDELVCQGSLGTSELTGLRVRPEDGIMGRCLRHNAIEALHEPSSDPELLGALASQGGSATRAALCAPLSADGKPFGALQVINKRRGGDFSRRDRYLLQAMTNAAALAVANARMAEQLVRQEVTARELGLAAEIQRRLLPDADPAKWPVFGLNRPIRQVSGDFFDFFLLPDQRIPFALGDVSGKGMNAALLMAKAASLFRCLGKRTDDPAALLSILNQELHETASRGMFVTMIAGTYDPATGRLHFANAGHEPPLLRRPDHSYESFPAEAPPLGILPEMSFRAHEIDLGGGEFYVFSDGLTEFRYGQGEQLGVDGLIQMVEGLSALPLAARLEALLAELDGAGWQVRDDLTVLAIDDAWVPSHD